MDTQISLLGGLFVVGGVRHLFVLDPLTEVIRKRGVPMPRLVLLAGSVFQLVAGLLLIFGLFVTPVALGLIFFTVCASVMMCNFWDMRAARNARRCKMYGCRISPPSVDC